jgi:hypothetical protein
MAKGMNDYRYDVGISLCKQDVDFAIKLTKAINPSLNVFFYEHRQEELITSSGPEAFANIFKEQSRVVVILSRKEWGESLYTEIERNAIVDSLKDRGYSHIMILPMAHGEIPAWYPSTRIYVDPTRFTVEQLARFIEFKVTEEGGKVKELTVEDLYQHLLNGVSEKKSLLAMQEKQEAIKCAQEEIKVLKKCFNRKSEFLRKSIVNAASWFEFGENVHRAELGYGDYELKCQVHFPELYQGIYTTQDFSVSLSLFQTVGGNNPKLLDEETRLFYYTPDFHGWAIRHLYEQATDKELLVLFRNRDGSNRYDLIKPLRTEQLVDAWFQKLLSLSTQKIARYIK